MKRLLIACLSCLALLPPAAAAPAGDAVAGERLHAENCTGCHDAGVYTRPDRRVDSVDALNRQLDACTRMTKKSFTADEIRDLATFLTERYYHFE